ncbi:hypothetical protein L6452_08536 [Arctium lappa]|uniref:Uncharacterized protein n=1 Tax=Arctium lappa TaxID=4217 RepID=A0ACB9DHJ4_ARCLA|nr:hypothetical protein L6452_08536 [Arctium lappa]
MVSSSTNPIKRIFRYLKGQPRKSTSGGCQFLGARLDSWQCKKQTTVSTSTTEAEYIAAASCCSQVLWIQNQMLDYGVTFLHTPIFIDNNSAISIVNNPVKHSKTKHIEISIASIPRTMAGLVFVDDHNELAMLQKPKQAEGFHQIVDFLKSSHIAYALTVNPTIYVEHLRQFWANASIHTDDGNQVLPLFPRKISSKYLVEWGMKVQLRFVQEVLNKELTDLTSFQEVYVPQPPKGKVFSNMKRPSKDFSGQETPLFSTMMVMSHSHGEVSGSQPTSDHPTDDLPTPFISINTPQIPVVKPKSLITQIYIRKKVQKVPSLPVSTPQQPASPLMEHSPLENIQRETIWVSPNPKKVLSKEKEKHVDSKAHTTDSAQGVDQDKGASARQKASTKRSKDPSRVVKTPKGGEDRYTYEELMDTLGTISLEVHNQDLEIKEMKKVITSQQVQITKLKKMVLKLVHKKKKTQFVLKKRSIDHDVSKKGETQEDESENKSPVGMESQFEGEVGAETEKEAVETAQAAETEIAAETMEEAETEKESATETVEPTVETEKVAAETGLSVEVIEIVETLVKAKHDTPKATQKAKGVKIKEGKIEKTKKEISMSDAKKKGKEKVVESEKPVKKQKQIDMNAELAKKMQEELEKENEIQTTKDRQIALDLSTKLNEEYQKSLKLASKKVTMKASRQRQPSKTRQRQPSKTFLAAQERRKMINFLKGSIGVPEGMFTNMSFSRIEELYKKEMDKLQGDFSQRVEPFPDSEEVTPTKEKTEVKKEESLAQKIGAIKRKKSIATKKQAKRPRIEEVEKEKDSERTDAEPSEPIVAPSAEQEQNCT